MLSFSDVEKTIDGATPDELNLDLTELIRQKLIESNIIGMNLYTDHFQSGNKNKTDVTLLSKKDYSYFRKYCDRDDYIKLGYLKELINIFPSSGLTYRNYKKIFDEAKKLGYTKGAFYVVEVKSTCEFLGIIGLECNHFKAVNGGKIFPNNALYKTEIKGFYVTPNMTLSDKAYKSILRNSYVSKIHEALDIVRKCTACIEFVDETESIDKVHSLLNIEINRGCKQ